MVNINIHNKNKVLWGQNKVKQSSDQMVYIVLIRYMEYLLLLTVIHFPF